MKSELPTSPASKESRPPTWRGDIAAVAACVATAAILGPFHALVDLANTSMLFLLVVALVAFRLGRRPALIAAFVSVALFDFFFVPPRLSFAVADVQYLVIFAVMLVVGLIITHLSQRLQARGDEAIERERQTHALYGLAGVLAGAVDAAAVDTALRDFVANSIGCDAHLVLSTDGGPLIPVATDRSMPQLEESLIRTALADCRPHRCGSPDAGAGLRLLLPLIGSADAAGVLVVDADTTHTETLRQHQSMLEAVAALTATAIERLHFVDAAQAARLETATERLRSSILSALSHDVRTPLTALYGLADSLALSALPEQERATAQAIRDQARRLNDMVSKLLDMARLRAGPVRLRREWQPLEEVVGSSLQLLGSALAGRRVDVELPADLPLLQFDAVLIERVLCNLLENACKYSPAGSRVAVAASVVGDAVEIAVSDSGPGFDAGSLEHVFAPFERGVHDVRGGSIAGSGLGLAICRAIVEAHGGRIAAANNPEGGARVVFTLPCGTPPPIDAEQA